MDLVDENLGLSKAMREIEARARETEEELRVERAKASNLKKLNEQLQELRKSSGSAFSASLHFVAC